MRRLALVCLWSGCSLLFDPDGVAGPLHDLAAAPDLGHSSNVDDLSAPEDLAVTPDDLAPLPDLTSRDLPAPDLLPCVPPTFVGFFDGGSPNPLDCNQCGCELDRLDNNSGWPVKLNHVGPPDGWSEALDDGGLTVAAPTAGNGEIDYFYSKNKFYLDGDFDLTVDYQALSQPQGGYLLLLVVGPPVDGGFIPNSPYGYAEEVQATATYAQWVFFTDDRYLFIDTNISSGTLRVRRLGDQLCASVVGHEESCHSGTGLGHAFVQFQAQVANAACNNACSNGCCDFRVHLSRLRLRHGLVVATP